MRSRKIPVISRIFKTEKIMKKLIFALAIAFSTAIGFSVAAQATDYVFLMPIRSSVKEGEKTGGLEDKTGNMLGKVCEILTKKTGDNISCTAMHMSNEALLTEKFAKEFIKQIEETNFAFIYLSSNDYYELQRYGYDKLVPGVQISLFKKTYDVGCFYTREGDKVTDVEQLRGKIWGGGYSYMDMRYFLLKNGVKDDPKEFFKEIKYFKHDEWQNMAKELVEGNVDVFNSASVHRVFGVGRDERFKTISEGMCANMRNTHMIAFRKDLPDDHKIKFAKIMINAHRDKDFQPFWFIFSALQGNFVPFDKEVFEKYTKPYVDTIKDNGWEKEYIAIVNKNGGF